MLLTSPTSLSPCPWHVDSNSFLPTHVAGYARSKLRLIVTTVTPSRDSGLTSALPPTGTQSPFRLSLSTDTCIRAYAPSSGLGSQKIAVPTSEWRTCHGSAVANQSMFISEVPALLFPYRRSPVAPLMELSRVVPNRL
ncbi:hypothetical protein U1Q18_048616 [Sarracenia purpurea var. burkii]